MVTRLSNARWRSAAGSQAHHRDTPPEDVRRVEAGLLARGSSLPSAFPGSSQWPKLTSAHRSQLRGQRRPCPDRTIGPHRFPSWLRGEWSRRPRPVNYGRGPTGRQDKYKDIFISLYYLKSASSMKAIPCRPIFETRTRVCGHKLAPHAALFRMRAETEVRATMRGRER